MSHIESMEKMIECLVNKAKAELDNGIENVDTHEMYEVVDIIKDLAEAKYKCTVVKAMEDAEEDGDLKGKLAKLTSDDEMRFYTTQNRRYQSRMPIEDDYPYYKRNRMPRMYYDGDMSSSSEYGTNGAVVSSRSDANTADHTPRQESRYDRARRNYTESKVAHNRDTLEDTQANIDELESYMRVLGDDITDMIKSASPEEKDILRQKLTSLTARI